MTDLQRKSSLDAHDSIEEAVLEARGSFHNDSAFMIAYERAIETEKGKDTALIYDPFAHLVAGDKGKELSDAFGVKYAADFNLWTDFHKQWTVVRTKFIDDHLDRIVEEHYSDNAKEDEQQQQPRSSLQFMNLGAGLDTRVLRLDSLAKIATAFEVDMEAINEPKNKLFDAINTKYKFKCPRKVVTADFTKEGELETNLIANGFDEELPTIILAEGLLPYLGSSSEQFLSDISKIAAASGSWLILNFLDHPGLPTDRILQLLTEGGWKDLTVNIYGDEVLDYGRFNKEYKPTKCFSFVVCHKK